jgi:hypothetical protein
MTISIWRILCILFRQMPITVLPQSDSQRYIHIYLYRAPYPSLTCTALIHILTYSLSLSPPPPFPPGRRAAVAMPILPPPHFPRPDHLKSTHASHVGPPACPHEGAPRRAQGANYFNTLLHIATTATLVHMHYPLHYPLHHPLHYPLPYPCTSVAL